jgi:hypothetical protein
MDFVVVAADSGQYDPAEKVAGSGRARTPEQGVPVPMKIETLPHSREQLTWNSWTCRLVALALTWGIRWPGVQVVVEILTR